MEKMIKQYTLEPAYIGNTTVKRYINGVCNGFGDIIADYGLSTYIGLLENEGYTQAYIVSDYEKKVEEAKENLRIAMEDLEMAKANPLVSIDE